MSLADDFLTAAIYASVGSTEGIWRQAVHSSYYAVFHSVGEAGQDMLFRDREAGRVARRNVSHESVTQRAKHYQSAKPGDPSWKADKWIESSRGRAKTPPSIQLVHLADMILDLQGRRITADYDFTVVVGEGQAKTSPHKARAAMDILTELKGNDDAAFKEMMRWIYFPKAKNSS